MCTKGQFISKSNCQAVNSSKNRRNEFVITSMRRVFVRFLEEIKESKKAFRNYLTFKNHRHTPTNAFIMINLKTDSTFMCIYPLFNVDKK